MGTSYDPMIAKLIAHGPTRRRRCPGSPTRSPRRRCPASPRTCPSCAGSWPIPSSRGRGDDRFLTEHLAALEPPLRLLDGARRGWRSQSAGRPLPRPTSTALRTTTPSAGREPHHRADAGDGDPRPRRPRRPRRRAAAVARARGDEDGDAADGALRRDGEQVVHVEEGARVAGGALLVELESE